MVKEWFDWNDLSSEEKQRYIDKYDLRTNEDLERFIEKHDEVIKKKLLSHKRGWY